MEIHYFSSTGTFGYIWLGLGDCIVFYVDCGFDRTLQCFLNFGSQVSSVRHLHVRRLRPIFIFISHQSQNLYLGLAGSPATPHEIWCHVELRNRVSCAVRHPPIPHFLRGLFLSRGYVRGMSCIDWANVFHDFSARVLRPELDTRQRHGRSRSSRRLQSSSRTSRNGACSRLCPARPLGLLCFLSLMRPSRLPAATVLQAQRSRLRQSRRPVTNPPPRPRKLAKQSDFFHGA